MSTPQRKRNLIVNYIPSNLQEEQLYELFQSVGAITSLRIMRNSDGTGRGYGFVEYRDPVAADAAIEQFDRLRLGNKKLKVAFARPGGTREGCNLFVKNLPKTWTTDRLTREFAVFGELLESRVLATNDSQSRRCGFVRFDLPRDAINAIGGMSGHIPHDGNFQIKVSHARKKMGRRDSSDSVSEHESPQRYQQQGQYPNNQPRSPYQRFSQQQTQQPNYYGTQYQMYPHLHDYCAAPESAETHWRRMEREANAYEMATQQYPFQHTSPNTGSNGSNCNGSTDSASSRSVLEKSTDSGTVSEQEEDRTIMMANLPTFLEEVHLNHLCLKYGQIENIIIQRDNNENNLGCAEVTFETVKQKNAAQKGLDGCEMCNKMIICH